jgi:vesicle-associated membrane protein 2
MAQYNKLHDTQQQVDQVVLIMKDNVEKVLQRDEKLSDIETRSEELQQGATRFEKISTKLKRKFFCKNMRFVMILAVIILIFILIILLIVLKK